MIRWRPKPRQGWAALLALVMLGTTYVLLDEDLGTPAPLFQEFTCRGRIEVSVVNGYNETALTIPETAVRARAVAPTGDTLAVYMVLWTREADDGKWAHRFDHVALVGENAFLLRSVMNGTQAYVTAADVEGRVCRGESGVLRARTVDR